MGRYKTALSAQMIPHMHGTLKRLTRQSYEVVMEELCAVNDNPGFLPDGSALMGGSWDTAGIAIYADALTIGIVNLAKLLEVHMERLTNPNLSGLPAFLVKKPGLNNGFMIVQYVTANLLGEITFLANSSSSFMRTVSAGQEGPSYDDVGAACKLYDSVRKLGSLVTMTMMTALQALEPLRRLGAKPHFGGGRIPLTEQSEISWLKDGPALRSAKNLALGEVF